MKYVTNNRLIVNIFLRQAIMALIPYLAMGEEKWEKVAEHIKYLLKFANKFYVLFYKRDPSKPLVPKNIDYAGLNHDMGGLSYLDFEVMSFSSITKRQSFLWVLTHGEYMRISTGGAAYKLVNAVKFPCFSLKNVEKLKQ